MHDILVASKGTAARADAERLRSDLVVAGLQGVGPVSEIADTGDDLGVGEILLTIIIMPPAKVAIGMVFDEVEKALLKLMEQNRGKTPVRIEVKDGITQERRRIPLRRDLVMDKAVSLAIKTARDIAKGWLT